MFRKFFLNRQFPVGRWLRPYCEASPPPSEAEQQLVGILKEKFPTASHVEVTDISGGCGAMFEVLVEADSFQGKRMVAQHKMVTEALKEQIKDMHGLRITTKVPDNS
ncbi:bolA-like protein 3 [Mizuhopecten yessoensis]|uniref:BolA-like protein 3 n=1 Tax=Mizuhopecten yessoensis TaxID=6573 RepID=A0A210PJ15_MIZYE|nr:bolA-like protein 3 [Mizuhopecten yessoensis]OWF36470.1 BolA-like protein 3 [Mizuhopecten yessoensis]